ncbi:MMPL family transporter [Actinomadura craniellae]|uniref:MMPL family transporter n=1 Tax=Actinomadura craniellae TaxID=2231787 RepID=A0A365H717_9ACTN|nr:MMPL family transporter [Actinomadura craniellae]RAY14877.1 MMPL family transporter [Actinomadura craniellae]
MLAGLGRLIHRRRWTSLVLILLITGVAVVWGPGVFSKFKQGGFEDPKADSTTVAKLSTTYFGSTNPDVLLLYSSKTMTVDDPRFMASALTTVSRLPRAQVAEVVSYWSFSGETAAPFVSRDRHSTFLAVKLRGSDDLTKVANYEKIKDRLEAPGLTTQIAGSYPLAVEFGEQVVADIVRAELISAPVLLILLILLFGALAAAVLPLFVGIFSILGGLAVVHAVTYVTDVSSFALEVITMLGVGLAIDYSLFIVSRYREELGRGADRETALANTMATAGRTIAISGITVTTALAGLLLFPQMFLRTIGLGGMATVLVAVFGALVLLPTLLALLGPKVEFGTMPWRRRRRDRPKKRDSGVWFRLGSSVMKHPLPYFTVVLVILAVLFQPFLSVQFGSIDARVLPEGSPSRVVVEQVKRDFPSGSAEPIDVVVSGDLIPRDWAPGSSPIPPYLDEFRQRLDALPGVTDARFSGYSQTYGGVRISVFHRYEPMDEEAQALVRGIRGMTLDKDGYPLHIDVGGSTAAQIDLMASLVETLPLMGLFVGVATFVLLFMFFGSVVLPLKAIVMNILSIGASFGAIVWGFQEGHLSELLDFTPTGGVEATSMVLILAVVFGLSMDYEVFLLSRIREEWDLTHDNRLAVARGMQHTGSIISSAAVLFLVVVAAFATAGITVVKLIGVGMFVAIVVDAVLVRSLLVPATMRFMGAANWWLPGPLAALHSRMDLRDHIVVPPARVRPTPPMRARRRPTGAYMSPAPHGRAGAPAPNGRTPNGRAAPVPQPMSAPTGPWRPWAAGPPKPPQRPVSRRTREIVPNPDGTGWQWRTDENDVRRRRP